MTDEKTVRILMIEDNSGDVLLFTEMLAECPGSYQVTRVDRLASAMELLTRDAFDLVVMDLNLPDAGGMEALRRVKERSSLPVIVLTGSFNGDIVAPASAAGETTFLLKGAIMPEDLHRAIASSMAKG